MIVPRPHIGARQIATLVLAILSVTASAAVWSQQQKEATLAIRRISEEQYRQTISDLFGTTISFGGRFEPDLRERGLQAIGASHVSVTGTGLEQYDRMGRAIARQVVSPQYRAMFMSCKPRSESKPDNACARQFLSDVGRLLYRRPLTKAELADRLTVASAAATSLHSFYAGLEMSLADMLMSPQLLFRFETGNSDPQRPGKYQLDAYSKASKLSFLLWNSTPDAQLLDAADRGELNTPSGLDRHVERMLASPRLKSGVRAFFSDMLRFDHFDTLAKDSAIYPKFDAQVAKDAREETLRTIVDLLIVQHGDYRDLFTSRKTFLTPALASVYAVPLPSAGRANGEPDGWQAYEYAANFPRAGILMHLSFSALHSHPGRSSPTIRGKALREVFMCQVVPDPPGNVEFTIVQETDNPLYKTARERLSAHASEAMCRGCHKITDPMGLALENIDGGGNFRRQENGVRIDTSGELDGKKFSDGVELGLAVRNHPATTRCLVNRLAAYANGRENGPEDAPWLKSLELEFASDGHRLSELMHRIVTSQEFFTASFAEPPQGPARAKEVVAASQRTMR